MQDADTLRIEVSPVFGRYFGRYFPPLSLAVVEISCPVTFKSSEEERGIEWAFKNNYFCQECGKWKTGWCARACCAGLRELMVQSSSNKHSVMAIGGLKSATSQKQQILQIRAFFFFLFLASHLLNI